MAWYNQTTQEIGRPFQGVIYWWEENSYGGIKSNSSPTVYSVSSVVEVSRIESGDITKYYRGIDSIYISKATSAKTDYAFHLEYLLMHDDHMYSRLVNRSGGTVRSLGFVIGANTDMTNSSWYKLFGVKCKNVEKAGSEGEMWKISADFSVSSIHISQTESDFGISRPVTGTVGVLTGNLCPFNNTESSIGDGSGNIFAYVTKNFSVTVNHNLQDLWTVGSLNKKNCIEGALDVTGSCDISLDEGGYHHFNDVVSGNVETTIQIDTGEGANDFGAVPVRTTLTNVRFDSSSIDVSPGSEGMMESAPFTAEQISVTSAT